VIREASSVDFPAALSVVRTAYPEYVQTEAGFRHRYDTAPAEARLAVWVAEAAGAIIGWSTSMLRYEESDGSASVRVAVLPAQRRRGLGSALLERALEHVSSAPKLFAYTGEDDRAFAERRGFRLAWTSSVSAVDPRVVESCGVEDTESVVCPMTEMDAKLIFGVDVAASRDIPHETPQDQLTFDQWKQRRWQHPDLDLELSQAACVNGRPVAISYLSADYESGRAMNSFTGTLRAFRGRGLARATKAAALARAAERGIAIVLTDNHDTNAAMLAVNRRLGYRPFAKHYTFVLDRRAK